MAARRLGGAAVRRCDGAAAPLIRHVVRYFWSPLFWRQNRSSRAREVHGRWRWGSREVMESGKSAANSAKRRLAEWRRFFCVGRCHFTREECSCPVIYVIGRCEQGLKTVLTVAFSTLLTCWDYLAAMFGRRLHGKCSRRRGTQISREQVELHS